MLLMALRLKEGERQWESGREAKRVAEREPTDTVNKLSQTLFWGAGRTEHELASSLSVS